MENMKLNFNKPLLSVRRRSISPRRMDNAGSLTPWPLPYRSELQSGPVGNPGAVPFHWEQIPGRPKEEPRTSDIPLAAPKPPPGRARHLHDCHQVSPSTRDDQNPSVNFRRGLSLEESVNMFETVEKNKSCHPEDCVAAFLDTRDTLSRTQSFFLNCSLSSLIGIDDLPTNTGGSFSSDPQTRKALMDRFLPAAKAMVEESPRQQAQEPQNMVDLDKPDHPHAHGYAKLFSDYIKNEQDKEADDSDDDCDHHGNLVMVCCLLPRFCLRSSVGLINPVPAMSVRTRAAPSHGDKLQPRSSSDGKIVNEATAIKNPEVEEKKVSLKEETQPFESCDALAYHDAPLSFIKDDFHKIKNAVTSSSRFPIKGFKTFRELLADQEDSDVVDSRGLDVEETVYVDTVQEVGNMKSRSANMQEDNAVSTNRLDQLHVIDQSVNNYKKSNVAYGEAKLLQNSAGITTVSSIAASNRKQEMETSDALRQNQDLKTTESREVAMKMGKQQQRTTNRTCQDTQPDLRLPLPLLLPKSPSDSWLWRTLPSLSRKTALRHSFHDAVTNSHGHVKRETQRLRYSEELLRPIGET